MVGIGVVEQGVVQQLPGLLFVTRNLLSAIISGFQETGAPLGQIDGRGVNGYIHVDGVSLAKLAECGSGKRWVFAFPYAGLLERPKLLLKRMLVFIEVGKINGRLQDVAKVHTRQFGVGRGCIPHGDVALMQQDDALNQRVLGSKLGLKLQGRALMVSAERVQNAIRNTVPAFYGKVREVIVSAIVPQGFCESEEDLGKFLVSQGERKLKKSSIPNFLMLTVGITKEIYGAAKRKQERNNDFHPYPGLEN